jgi:hypothetical protein
MRRRLRLAVLVAAAALQLVAPLSAYARVAQLPDAVDLCTAANAVKRAAAEHGAPQQKPAQHRCLESLCCIGATVGASAPPRVVVPPVLVEVDGSAIPLATNRAARASIVAAAPPRGPPPIA